MKALVIGAGIGGLASGIALKRAGIDVELFERSGEMRDVGAGISLWANAIRALETIGLGAAAEKASLAYAVGSLRSWRGETLAAMPIEELQRSFKIPVIILHRADLLAALSEAFGPQHLHLGNRCVGFQQDESGVIAEFADGSHMKADLLIGADGLHSVIRAQLHGQQPPRYAGCTAWRAVVPFEGDVRATETWGYGSIFGQVPIINGRVYWYATRNQSEGERHGDGDEKAELLKLFRGWHAPIESLIHATDPSGILRNDIYDRPPIASWGQGRVTLLGDAAHPMTPYLGQGGCQALEDAVVLATSLRGASDVVSALRHYEAKRIPRVNSLVKQSRRVGQVAQLQNPLAVRLRNAALKQVSPRLQARTLIGILNAEF